MSLLGLLEILLDLRDGTVLLVLPSIVTRTKWSVFTTLPAMNRSTITATQNLAKVPDGIKTLVMDQWNICMLVKYLKEDC